MLRLLVVLVLLSFWMAEEVAAASPQDRDRRGGERVGQPSRLSVAEQEIETVRRLLADLSVKLSVLERQVRETNGRMEEMEFRNRSLEETLEKTQKQLLLLSADLAEARAAQGQRIDQNVNPALSQGGKSGVTSTEQQQGDVQSAQLPKRFLGDAQAGSTGSSASTEPALSLPPGSPREQFDFAFAFVRKNDLESGGKLLADIVAAHGSDPVAGNALFWLGRIRLQKNQPAEAARNLLTLLEQFPEHPKKADAYVDLAASLIKLGAQSDACDALFEFDRLNDQGGPRLVERAKRLASEARCS